VLILPDQMFETVEVQVQMRSTGVAALEPKQRSTDIAHASAVLVAVE